MNTFHSDAKISVENRGKKWLIWQSQISNALDDYVLIIDKEKLHIYYKSDLFEYLYEAQDIVSELYPREDVDFSYGGSYSQYNWELFFHIPLIIADRLSKNQRFKEAQQWFHYIFNPTDTSALPTPQRYWQMGHFFKTTQEEYQLQQIKNVLRLLAKGGSEKHRWKLSASELAELEELETKVMEWRKNPFQPHLIARLRTTAYQKTVVMKYIDNLIAWGDQLFRRDTIESINEATQLYILAAEILGPRPEIIPPSAKPQTQTYRTIEPYLGEFSNALVQIEDLLQPAPEAIGTIPLGPVAPIPTMLYFCVPKNEKLLGYWDTVADRLFKIRHCMNIEGVVRQLPLFEPPIEPGLLVKAAAAGVDISSALNDINAALPHYRFQVMVQKASELCADIKQLGAALLSALEKRDAEALALLRASHEIKVLKAVRQVREQQIEEAKEALKSFEKSEELAKGRENFYKNRPYMNVMEVAYLDQNKREYELTKHISLVRLDPISLLQLKETGECFVDIPEYWFDLDYPGHYMRRIKSVSITIPCVTGPYTSVSCTLTLLKNSVRISNTTSNGSTTSNDKDKYSRVIDQDDSRFRDNIVAIQSIATSSAKKDKEKVQNSTEFW